MGREEGSGSPSPVLCRKMIASKEESLEGLKRSRSSEKVKSIL